MTEDKNAGSGSKYGKKDTEVRTLEPFLPGPSVQAAAHALRGLNAPFALIGGLASDGARRTAPEQVLTYSGGFGGHHRLGYHA